MAWILRRAPARPRQVMARGGRLPRAAGRPPRFLRTGHRRAISLSEAQSPGCAQGRQTHARGGRGCPWIAFSVGHRMRAGAKGRFASWPGRPRCRGGVHFRDGLLAAAEVANAVRPPLSNQRGRTGMGLRAAGCPDCDMSSHAGVADPAARPGAWKPALAPVTRVDSSQ